MDHYQIIKNDSRSYASEQTKNKSASSLVFSMYNIILFFCSYISLEVGYLPNKTKQKCAYVLSHSTGYF